MLTILPVVRILQYIQILNHHVVYLELLKCCMANIVRACLVMFDSFVTPWAVATRLLCPWNFPGKNIGVFYHFYSRGSSQSWDRVHISVSPALAGRFFTTVPPGKQLNHIVLTEFQPLPKT